jgi:hypothetical protein
MNRTALSKISCSLAAAAGLAMVAATPAAATTTELAAANCQHNLGAGRVVSAAYIEDFPGDRSTGAVQLCKDSSSRYWGYVVFYRPMAAGRLGEAWLDSYVNGELRSVWNCGSPGGNLQVQPGQTMCWTPKITSTSSTVKFRAYGTSWGGGFNAYGETATTR